MADYRVRYTTAATLVNELVEAADAPNEAFTGWSRTFTDPRLCAAIVDRLTFNATLIETGTESYRLARSTARSNGEPPRQPE